MKFSTFRQCFVSFFIVIPLLWSSAGNASLVFPQIRFDTRLGAGQNLFSTQGVHYFAGEGWAVSGRALSLTFDGVNFIELSNGTVDLRGRFINAYLDGDYIVGNFTSWGDGNADLIVADDTGILLAGVYGRRQIHGLLGTGHGISDSTFTVIGGSLASYFTSSLNQGWQTNVLYGVFPLFTSESYLQNYDGHIDGIIGVPAPNGLFLVGIAFMAMLIRRSKFT